MNKECATITLHSNYVSSLGSSELVFRNIPIKKILGDMYDKYNKFKLVLNTHAGNYLAGATNREFQFRITGLDFINTIDYKLLTRLQKPAIFVPFVKTTATQNLNQFTANHGAVFTKPSNQMVDITLTFTDRQGYLVGGNIGANMFVFSIYGIEE
jgi:hypothetical protein